MRLRMTVSFLGSCLRPAMIKQPGKAQSSFLVCNKSKTERGDSGEVQTMEWEERDLPVEGKMQIMCWSLVSKIMKKSQFVNRQLKIYIAVLILDSYCE